MCYNDKDIGLLDKNTKNLELTMTMRIYCCIHDGNEVYLHSLHSGFSNKYLKAKVPQERVIERHAFKPIHRVDMFLSTQKPLIKIEKKMVFATGTNYSLITYFKRAKTGMKKE